MNIVPGVRKIAVLRANALGDFIFALPALDSLRPAYPDAEMTLLGLPWHAEFLAGRPGPIDRVIVVPPYPGVSTPDGTPIDHVAVDPFFARMREERFDIAIQIHGGGGNSNPFIARLGAGLTIGTRSQNAIALDRTIPYLYFQKEVLRFLEVVSLAGARPVTIEPRLCVVERDRREAARVRPPDGRPLVVLHPGVGSPDRRWPARRFAAVGDALAREGARIVVTGSSDETELVATVCRAMAEPAEPTAGALSICGLAGLLERASLVVANDTGPLHLAGAVGAATVGIFWCVNLINGGPTTRARHFPLISWNTYCSECGANQITAPCRHPVSYVEDVSVDAVLAASRRLYAEFVHPDEASAITAVPAHISSSGMTRVP